MSTRCQIGFYRSKEAPIGKWEALLYRHSDGYPDGVLPEIEPFLRWWEVQRGMSDIEYCSARLLQYLCNEYDGASRQIAKEITGKAVDILGKNTDYTGILCYGICKGFHGDIEYFYKIYPYGIDVYKVPFLRNFKVDPTRWSLDKEILLRKEETCSISQS